MLSYFSSLNIHPSPRAPRVDAERAANAETVKHVGADGAGANAPLGASFNSPGFLPRGTGVYTPDSREPEINAPPSGVLPPPSNGIHTTGALTNQFIAPLKGCEIWMCP
jgi:hypothetical protein